MRRLTQNLPKFVAKFGQEPPPRVVLQRRVYGNLRSRLQIYMRRINYTLNSAPVLLDWFLGCDAETLLTHLESRMLPGMSWENYGASGWHVDHIQPLTAFDFYMTAEVKAGVHFTNLQPLWADWNISKGGAKRL